MKKIIIAFLGIAVGVFSSSLQAHPWKPSRYVIVDTDCGLDDMRTLSLLLSSPGVRVVAIIASNGVLDAETGCRKINELLTLYHHEGIPAGICRSAVKAKNCDAALSFSWSDRQSSFYPPVEAAALLNNLFTHVKEPLTMVCLGPLTTAAVCMDRCPDFSKKVKEIVWSVEAGNMKKCLNFYLDKDAFKKVSRSPVPLHLIEGSVPFSYQDSLPEKIKENGSVYARQIYSSLMASGHFMNRQLFDEVTAIYLHYPSLFSCDTTGKMMVHRMHASMAKEDFTGKYLSLLSGTVVMQNQVFQAFPADTSAYFPDVQEIMLAALGAFGRDEWTAQVITAELHRHVGEYAVIGVKMGMRARDFFGAGVDEMQIVSYAGLKPPFSCLNDGLQVSTGATLGHGLISVAGDTVRKPCADFSYLGRKIRITLKDEYRQKVEKELKELALIYGLDSNIYWDLVRQSALNYWRRWDRNQIFDIEVL